MVTSGDVTEEHGPERMQDIIFAREPAEVYLLLDHLSGRSDKSLAAAIGAGEDSVGKGWIQKICEIGWPPRGTSVELAAQAETLLMAKDRLNAAAKPANGASIAFTLLVAGDDEATEIHHARRSGGWLGKLAFWRDAESPPPLPPERGGGTASPNPPAETARNGPSAAPPGGGGGGNGNGHLSPLPGGVGGGRPPSRMSLARLAYPGLIGRAGSFNWQIKAIILLLFSWLIFTCVLSWDIAAGHAILGRLDAIETVRAAIFKRIAAAEITPPATSTGVTQGPGAGVPPASGVTPTGEPPAPEATPRPVSSALKPLPVQRYCERPRLLPPAPNAPPNVKIDQFEDATQRQICDELAENRVNYGNSREDLADWLAPWAWLKWPSHRICGGERCLKDETIGLPHNDLNEQQWAAVLIEVLATSVLPLCYGFLGAGAAVVRNIWGKMRDSLLSPRDLTLSLGQLALGVVIGACIGLFIAPSGVGSQGAGGLTGSVTLTPSALSFIAGFGVEGVFVALESLIKRVFNIPEPKP